MDIKENTEKVAPLVSLYSLSATNNKGEEVSLKEYKGKKLMIVNLASQCGFTPQYNELEELYRNNKEDLVILGFPSNDFGGQEPGSDEEIANFCKLNFGVTFPLFKKAEVKGESKQPVYKWLSDPSLNGWNDQEPTWNFSKYLVDENGYLMNFYSASVSPLAEDIQNMLKAE